MKRALLLLLGLVIAAACYTSYKPTPHGKQAAQDFAECKGNLKRLAESLEAYAASHQGRYPEQLAALGPVPACPACGKVSYTDYHTYRRGYAYRFSCVGDHHQRMLASFARPSLNYPYYDSQRGMVDHP